MSKSLADLQHHDISRSLPIRVFLNTTTGIRKYIVTIPSPFSLGRKNCVDNLAERLRDDGSDAGAVEHALYCWANKQPPVRSVTLRYSDPTYSIRVVLDSPTGERITDLLRTIHPVLREVGVSPACVYFCPLDSNETSRANYALDRLYIESEVGRPTA